jgi:arylsulfatase A-like enzyme
VAPGRLVPSLDELRRATVGRQSRLVVRDPQPSFQLEVPRGAYLRTGFGVAPRAWQSGLEEIAYAVTFDTQDRRVPLFRGTLSADKASEWHDIDISLDPAAGISGTLRMETEVVRGSAPSDRQIFWSNPIVGPVTPLGKPNILLVSIDTLRADHLGCYGYGRDTSPNLDELAGEGVLFRQAIAPSTWTLPSHASMLTGLYPHKHGAVLFGSATPLRRRFDTLAELLWRVGYRTGGFTGGGFLSSNFGFDQGFGRYTAYGTGAQDDFEQSARDAFEWMRRPAGAPFFAFLHTYAVHMPYVPPAPYDTLFDPDYAGPFKKGFTEADYFRYLGKDDLDAAVVEHLKALYDAGIRHMDAIFGAFFDQLKQSPIAGNTCVIVTSDHGEEFKEHGNLFHHTPKLYDELIRVPLLVWCPSRFAGGRAIEEQVSLVDLVPTILALADAPLARPADGVSLLGPLLGRSKVAQRALYSEVNRSIQALDGNAVGVRTGERKMIRADWEKGPHLFDLRSDPGETRDVAAEQSAERENLSVMLESYRAQSRAAMPKRKVAQVLDPGTIERLRALGYER